MDQLLDKLEERVHAAVELIGRLRSEVARLEADLAEHHPVETPEVTVAPDAAALAEEIARLRDERTLVRERIRGLIKEIDAVSW